MIVGNKTLLAKFEKANLEIYMKQLNKIFISLGIVPLLYEVTSRKKEQRTLK